MKNKACGYCGGSGERRREHDRCPVCKGDGIIHSADDHPRPCSYCGGSGEKHQESDICPVCAGAGWKVPAHQQ